MKCDHYWPYDDNPITVAEMTLKLIEEIPTGDWTVRKLTLQNVSLRTPEQIQNKNQSIIYLRCL